MSSVGNTNSVFYAESYHPIQAGSIDGTDIAPHDNAVLRAHLCSQAGLYDPFRDPKAIGDPYCTVFVGRLSRQTDEETILKAMNKYGRVKRMRLVRDIVTGASRGYAFVEYESEREMLRAYEDAHHSIIDGSEVIVDYYRQQLMPGWIPRRLGGGLGGKKESGQLRFGGRERPFRAPLRPIPYDDLKRLGIPPPPEGRYMSRFQIPSPPRRKSSRSNEENSPPRRRSKDMEDTSYRRHEDQNDDHDEYIRKHKSSREGTEDKPQRNRSRDREEESSYRRQRSPTDVDASSRRLKRSHESKEDSTRRKQSRDRDDDDTSRSRRRSSVDIDGSNQEHNYKRGRSPTDVGDDSREYHYRRQKEKPHDYHDSSRHQHDRHHSDHSRHKRRSASQDYST